MNSETVLQSWWMTGAGLLTAAVIVVVSCICAHWASCGRCNPLWGLLGPLGVMVAGFRGVHEMLADRPRADAPSSDPADGSTEPQRTFLPCPSCGARIAFDPSRGDRVPCECGSAPTLAEAADAARSKL